MNMIIISADLDRDIAIGLKFSGEECVQSFFEFFGYPRRAPLSTEDHVDNDTRERLRHDLILVER